MSLVLRRIVIVGSVGLFAPCLVAQNDPAGEWLLTEDVYGNPLHQRLSLKVDGGAVTGTLGRRPIQGTVAGTAIQFALKDDDSTDEFTGTLSADGMGGTVVHTEKVDPTPFKTTWQARRVLPRRAGPAERHEFVPTAFYRQFSASNAPVLRIWPGDTVHTTTVDAGGAG